MGIPQDWQTINRTQIHTALSRRAWPDSWPEGGDEAQRDDQRDQFMITATDAIGPNDQIVPDWAFGDDKDPGFASIVTRPLGNAPLRLGTSGLCGCSLLIVVSLQRVYLGHYWEEAQFGSLKAFQKQVIEFLATTYQAPIESAPVQDGLQMHRQDFSDQVHTYAVILAPDSVRDIERKPTNNFQYYKRVPQFGNAVAKALGIPEVSIDRFFCLSQTTRSTLTIVEVKLTPRIVTGQCHQSQTRGFIQSHWKRRREDANIHCSRLQHRGGVPDS